MKPIKKLGKAWLCRRLEKQIVRLRKKHDFTVVAVAGSAGKTSTKLAIAKVLSGSKRVQFQQGNYNDRLTVPLIFFGQTEPGLFNIPAWLKLLAQNRKMIRRDYPFDIVVVELGTDGTGQMQHFAYLKPDVVVLTSIAAEHMEYFKTLDAVAAEELAVTDYAKELLINTDDTPAEYLNGLSYHSYGVTIKADYMIKDLTMASLGDSSATLQLQEQTVAVQLQLLGRQGAKIALAAAATAELLEYEAAAIVQALATLTPVSGRLQTLPGVKNSTLLDDTYNASPIAVKAALDVLYSAPATQRIAILGSMNELGEGSAAEHQAIGAYCDPSKLNLLITIGSEAEKYLAPAAQEQGCTTHSFNSPYEAGAYALQNIQDGAVVLAKGSQNGVFAEEALKSLLADPADASKLVRQSPYWLAQKKAQFGKPSARQPAAPADPPV